MTVLTETKTERAKPLVSPDASLNKSGKSVNAEEFANIFEFHNKNFSVQKNKISSLMMANAKALGQTEIKKQEYDYSKPKEPLNKFENPAEKSYEKKEDDTRLLNKKENDINYNDANLYVNAYPPQRLENLNTEKSSESVKPKTSEKTEKTDLTKLSQQENVNEPIAKSAIVLQGKKAIAVEHLAENVSNIKSKIDSSLKNDEIVDNKAEKVNEFKEVSKTDDNKKVLADVSNVQKSSKSIAENAEKLKDKPEINFEKDTKIKVSDSDAPETTKANTAKIVDAKPLMNTKAVENQKVQKNIEQTEDVTSMVARMSIQDLSKDTSNFGKNGTNSNNPNQKQLESKAIGSIDLQSNVKLDFASKLKIEKPATPQRSELEKSVLTQVNEKMNAELKLGNKEVTISLKPDNLGKIDIKLTSVNGVLTAQIETESQHVKDIINKGLEALKQNLTEQGINVGKMVVQTSESSNSNSQQSSENQQFFDKSNLSNQNQFSRNSQNSSENGLNGQYENKLSIDEIEVDSSSQPNKLNHRGSVDYTI